MAKLLTYDGQVIDPTAYIYIYAYGCVIEPPRGHFKRAQLNPLFLGP